MFEHARLLSVSRETLASSIDEYSSVIRHSFPNLLLLVVLINDNIDFDEIASLDLDRESSDPETYDPNIQYTVCEMNELHDESRSLFAQPYTGLFSEPVSNTGYTK